MKLILTKLAVVQGVLSLVASFPTAAQIKPDATLPQNSLIRQQGNTTLIEGGTKAGNNLFHSFTQFSVPISGTAYFNSSPDIQNIFSRVTGSQISQIDGILKANSTTNLFLLNPNGIIFGANAQLKIGGSFVATTANAIGFGHLGIFSASVPNSPALLTVNPNSFLFNQIATQPISAQANLQVSTGNSLLLLGGNVSLDGISNGGQILAPGGRVELGGLAGIGTVGLNVTGTNLSLTFPLRLPRADVSLNNGAQVNVMAGGGGSIAVNANNFNMLGGSKLGAGIAENTGSVSSHGGNIDVDTTDAITIDNSFISNTVLGTGNAGNVSISTKSLSLTNLGIIDTFTSGQGNAGDVKITASDFINIDGTGGIGGLFSIVASGTVGSGGNIDITSKSLNLTNGGTIYASTFGKGNAGDIKISASDFIKIDGMDDVYNSGLFSQLGPGAVGSGGNIDITSKSLSLTNGGKIDTSTFGQGNAGDIKITASDFIKIDGTGGGQISGLFSTLEPGAVGSGGNIDITSKSLSLTNGGKIDTSTFGQGNAGDIKITASDFIKIDGTGGGQISGLFSKLGPGAVGSGGNIDITSKSLSLTNGGTIDTSTLLGQGNAGDIKITASDFIKIDGASDVSNSGLSSIVISEAGSGGNIDITSKSLSLTNGGEIDTSTYGKGNAGDIKISASDFIKIDGTGDGTGDLSNSGLFSKLELGAVGSGGNIDITSKSLSLTNSGVISASTFGKGNAGDVTVNADNINIDGIDNNTGSSSGIFSAAVFGSNGNAGTIALTSSSLSITNGGVVSIINQGSYGGGSIVSNVNNLELKGGGEILSTAYGSGSAGDINLNVLDGITISGSNPAYFNLFAEFGIYTPDNYRYGVDTFNEKSGIYANTAIFPGRGLVSTGNGGSINIKTGLLNVDSGANISVNSAGSGNAGDINIKAANGINLNQQGAILAGTTSGEGGNITLQANSLQLRHNSPITATSGNNGNGGNLNINANTIVALENSPITANAEQGKGGNIQITTQGLFNSRNSPITASSQYGVNGVININRPAVDPSKGLTEFTTTVVNIPQLVAQSCHDEDVARSTLTLTGKGGLPPNPIESVDGGTILTPYVMLPTGNAPNKNGRQATNTKPRRLLVEATGWTVNERGEVVLVANSPTGNSYFSTHSPTCSSSSN